MSRARRLAAQILLLPALWALADTDQRVFTVVVSISAVAAWIVSVAVAALLMWLMRVAERETGTAPVTLSEAADNAVTMALIATGIAVGVGMAAARVLGLLDHLGPFMLATLGWALVLVGVPALSWLGTLRRVWLPMLGTLRRR